MDNPVKGEVSFTSKGKTYKLVFSNNTFCALENHLNRGIMDIFHEIQSWAPKTDAKGKILPETKEDEEARLRLVRLSFCRSLFWAGLSDHQPGITIEQAGELMTDAGGLLGVMCILASGLSASQPRSGEASGTPRPMNRAERRKRGTGPAS